MNYAPHISFVILFALSDTDELVMLVNCNGSTVVRLTVMLFALSDTHLRITLCNRSLAHQNLLVSESYMSVCHRASS